ncbi:unnamed protein product [Euphydryas editha]|uniref:Reverse transcriptase domain-containing protein n=1 Tax=Euphydryas editha TaxID=104508 RepID=A0AAU9U1L6_EUPED|nr:unnamed protein product [Euphydryas editha]
MIHKPGKPAHETSSYQPISSQSLFIYLFQSNIKKLLPHSIYSTIRSYMENRVFFVNRGEARSDFFECIAGVSQGSVLGPVLYNIFTYDLPQSADVTIATYADDAAFLSSSVDPIRATVKLQKQLNDTHAWLNKWRIKASAPKSFHITFSLRQGDCPPVKLDNIILPQTNSVIGFLLGRRLTWKDHIKAERDETNHRFRNLLWLLGRQSTLSTNNKLLVYTTILKPIWIYGIQIWSTASKSKIMCLQRVQNNSTTTTTFCVSLLAPLGLLETLKSTIVLEFQL